MGVVLSGALDDGAAGSVAITARGGLLFAQDPDEAVHSGMPLACAKASDAELLPAAAIAGQLVRLVGEEVDTAAAPAPSELMERETAVADMDPSEIESVDRPGTPSSFSCPDCHGVLWQIDEGRMRRFRCRVGHAWSVDSLLAEHGQAVEGALWMALRSLEEKAALSAQLSDGARRGNREISAERFAEQAIEAQRAAELIRRMLAGSPDVMLTGDPTIEPDPAG